MTRRMGRYRLAAALTLLSMTSGFLGAPRAVFAAEPPRGAIRETERKAILDALRPGVEQEVKQAVRFRVITLRVRENGAYVEAEPVTPAGAPLDYRSVPRYARAIGNGEARVVALLRQASGAWKVVYQRLGAKSALANAPLPQDATLPPGLLPGRNKTGGGVAASVHTPTGAERKAILDALRVPIAHAVKRPVVFQVDRLRASEEWAFLTGLPLQPNGKRLDYKGTSYADAIEAGAFDDGVVALLRRVRGKWTVVTYTIGATDVPWEDWDTRYHAPAALFPHYGQNP